MQLPVEKKEEKIVEKWNDLTNAFFEILEEEQDENKISEALLELLQMSETYKKLNKHLYAASFTLRHQFKKEDKRSLATLFDYAVRGNTQLAVIKELISYVNTYYSSGDKQEIFASSFKVAVASGKLPFVLIFLEEADFNPAILSMAAMWNEAYSPLGVAVAGQQKQIAYTLLLHGADMNYKEEQLKATIKELAEKLKSTAIVDAMKALKLINEAREAFKNDKEALFMAKFGKASAISPEFVLEYLRFNSEKMHAALASNEIGSLLQEDIEQQKQENLFLLRCIQLFNQAYNRPNLKSLEEKIRNSFQETIVSALIAQPVGKVTSIFKTQEELTTFLTQPIGFSLLSNSSFNVRFQQMATNSPVAEALAKSMFGSPKPAAANDPLKTGENSTAETSNNAEKRDDITSKDEPKAQALSPSM